jgi:hypothetical protein
MTGSRQSTESSAFWPGSANYWALLGTPTRQPGINFIYTAEMAQQHGTSTAYRDGCRCPACRAGNTQRGRDYQARRAATQNVVPIAQPKTRTSAPPPEPLGDNELAVIAQCDQLPKAAEKQSIVAQAKALARILDNAELISMWPTTSRQLQSLLATLDGPPRKSRGRLAAVQSMVVQPRKAAQ